MSRYRYNEDTGQVEEISPIEGPKHSLQIIMDISPYEHTITGEMVTSRRQHRELLRRFQAVEVGNEKAAFMRYGGKAHGESG